METMMRAIQVSTFGGRENLRLEQLRIPQPETGEVLIAVEYAGVNFVDTYYRRGWYKPAQSPFTPGMEVSGTVKAIGEGVSKFLPGDRVVAVMSLGGYAEYQAVPVANVIKIPDGLDTRIAAVSALQGFTAYFLTHITYPIHMGDTVLIHAAAGGVGGLLCQLARLRGATVIGTVSTVEKEARARRCGCHHVIRYDQSDFASETRRLTEEAGVAVVYDSVGRDTFDASLQCLKQRGTLVLFGQSSGEVPPFDPQALRRHGSLFLTRPTLLHYMQPRDQFLDWADTFLCLVRDGQIEIAPAIEMPLENAAKAHELLESRGAAGKILLRMKDQES